MCRNSRHSKTHYVLTGNGVYIHFQATIASGSSLRPSTIRMPSLRSARSNRKARRSSSCRLNAFRCSFLLEKNSRWAPGDVGSLERVMR